MDILPELDDYIHESIEYSLGLPVSEKTLELKLRASEDAQNRLQELIFMLQDQLKEKDAKIDRSRAEATMNAQALRKYIDENQRLASECADLMSQCTKWKEECLLYDRDREALMEFGNDAEERAKEAEVRAVEAEDRCMRLMEDLKFYRQECEIHEAKEARAIAELHALRHRIHELEYTRTPECNGHRLDCSQCSSQKQENQDLQSHLLSTITCGSSGVGTTVESHLLDSVISLMLTKEDTTRAVIDETAAHVHSFLEAHTDEESCQRLLELWESLKPCTRKILALAAEVESLQKAKEHLRINLQRAEEEVSVLFEENNVLDKENKRLLRQCYKEKHQQGSSSKHSCSVAAKGKRKSSPNATSSLERVIDFNVLDSPRQPLSPLQHNSPDSRKPQK